MDSPNILRLDKEETDLLIFSISDRLEILEELRITKDADESDLAEEKKLVALRDRLNNAKLKWKKVNDQVYSTNLPEGNLVLRVEY